jgi:uncharacterized membrane protein YqjE
MNGRLKDTVLIGTLSDLVEDVTDLLQKEVRLAKAELSEKVSTKLRAGLWMSITGVLGICTTFVLIEAAIFAIASLGLALHWSCLIVAAALAVAAVAAYAIGSADAAASITPTRTLHQVHRDIAATRSSFHE